MSNQKYYRADQGVTNESLMEEIQEEILEEAREEVLHNYTNKCNLASNWIRIR